MGLRKRGGEKIKHKGIKAKEKADDKLFSRSMAMRALASGADPSEERFASHTNYHIRRKSFLMSGKALPENAEERAELCKKLHIKDNQAEQEEAPVIEEAASDV